MNADNKIAFANTISDHVSLQMSDCERYGMTWGCDIDCPVLRAGKCKLKDTDKNGKNIPLSTPSELYDCLVNGI